VTRVVEQKTGLLSEQSSYGNSAGDEIMSILKERKGVYIILGNGNADSEKQIEELAKRHEQLLYVKAYSEKLSKALYANGNLFLMPSLFEPCGISQMLAMRDGQPCLVNSVGGLRDTVMNGVNGFAFYGETMQERADNFVATAKRAIDIFFNQKLLWDKISIEAAKARFTWEQSAHQYIQQLYS
jgi:starch synthase